ncbi:monocarboxylate transporter [Bisporella sp. PMI_857]|nr:monocarboxylate transporter [Bisporella sp. PMI_857]
MSQEELSAKFLSQFRVRELLMRFGIPPPTANNVAVNELLNWPIEEVQQIMQKIVRPTSDYCPLKMLGPDPDLDESGLGKLGKWFLPSTWVRPPLHLIRRAVTEQKVLCVNKSCEWKFLEGGYMAISHVWAEGIRADPKARGITREHLLRVFEVIQNTGAEWIWLDVLSVPNADPAGMNLSDEEKHLQVDVINTLPQVYEQAEAVIVLDALLLQMHTSSPLDVAVGLVCGAWTKRVWTYQEIRLAKKALIVTAEKYVRNVGVSLTDISFGSATRESTQPIDYARALFALLGLRWDSKWTSHEQVMHGSKRMSISPRWAPSRLTGLEGRIEPDMTWESNGLKGMWYKTKIVKYYEHTTRSKRRTMEFLLEGGTGDSFCQVQLGVDEDPETIENFKVTVVSGKAHLLCKHQIAEGQGHGAEAGTASQALVVSAYGDSKDGDVPAITEVDVLFAVALQGVKRDSQARQVTVILRH